MCIVVQVCLQNHLKNGFFLSNMHSALLLFNMQSSTVSKWKLAPVMISGHLSIFQSACIFSKRLYIFKALSYFQSAFILFPFKALLFIFSLWVSAYLFSLCELALFIFFFQEHYSALTLISGCVAHNFLIMLWLFLIIVICFNISINYVQNF